MQLPSVLGVDCELGRTAQAVNMRDVCHFIEIFDAQQP